MSDNITVRKKISITIPVFRNEKSIGELYSKINSVLLSSLSNYDYEYVFVDDGSDDHSLAELIKIRNNDEKVKIITFSRNFGQTAATIAGLREVTGDCVINMSADLQEPIELIPEMVKEWENSNEIVICHRTERDDGFVRNSTSRFFYSLIKLSNPLMPKGGFDFLLLGRKAIDEFNKLNQKNRFFQGDILWLGFAIKFIPYKRIKRTIGKSQWTFSKRLKYFIDGVLNTTYWPIRLMSFLGFFVAFAGFIYAFIVVYARLINATPFKGYAPIIIIMLIMGGLIMIMLGVIGGVCMADF